MRAVLDSNVWISGIAFPGQTRELLGELKPGRIVTVVSGAILDEIADVLRHKFKYSAESVSEIASMIRARSELISPAKTVRAVARDPDDDRVVECAIEGGAGYIVSGDSHLLLLKRVHGIEVVTPARLRAVLDSKP